ncbi:MAG: hypothetical protein A2162_06435 [Deltaproteobacteria bacterium RBG_13_52_11b]|nr:MAG: hypothetical protein A2162_06435 [Deltaproteobacteria bacterium RBG_13_52_11b]
MQRCINALLTGTGMVTAGLTVLVTLLLLYEVITRYFFHDPSIWALDFTMYAICYLTFLGAAWLQREEGHVRVEIFTAILKPRHRAFLTGVTSVIAFLSCAIFCWQAFKLTLSAYQEGQFIDGSIVVPRSLILGIMPFGLFFLCIEFARKAWQQFQTFRSAGKQEVNDLT